MKLKIIAVAVAILYLSIFLHEFGHYLVFRNNGIEVEKVSVGAIWKLKLTVFTDSRGTEYEIGPLPLYGYTLAITKKDDINLARMVEIGFSGVAVNALIILFLTPFYFSLRKRWRENGLDFLDSFPERIFKVALIINFILLVNNTLWLAPSIDVGGVVYYILVQVLGEDTAYILGIVLNLGSIFFLIFYGYKAMESKIYKICGWKYREGNSKKHNLRKARAA